MSVISIYWCFSSHFMEGIWQCLISQWVLKLCRAWESGNENNCLKEKEEERERSYRQEGHVKMEEEIGALLPQTKELRKHSDPRRGKNGFYPRAFGRSMVMPNTLILGFMSPVMREYIFYISDNIVCGVLLSSLQ